MISFIHAFIHSQCIAGRDLYKVIRAAFNDVTPEVDVDFLKYDQSTDMPIGIVSLPQAFGAMVNNTNVGFLFLGTGNGRSLKLLTKKIQVRTFKPNSRC